MMLAVIAAAASAPASMPPPSAAPLTAESVTTPRVDIECKVLDRDRQIRTIEFQSSGMQGYSSPGIPSVRATEPSFVVTKDETGLFASAEALYDNTAFEKFSGEWRRGKLGRFDRSGRVYSAVQFFPNRDGSTAIVMERQSPPQMSAAPDFAFAGLCRFTETPQSPLDKAPKDVRP